MGWLGIVRRVAGVLPDGEGNVDLDGVFAPTANPTFTGNVVVPDADADTEALNRQTADGRYAPKRLTLNAQSDSYTAVLADEQKLVEMGKATAQTFTVPPNSSVAFAVGTQIHVVQTGAGQVTLTPGSGVTINGSPGLKTRAQWSTVTLVKRATDTWLAMGDLAA